MSNSILQRELGIKKKLFSRAFVDGMKPWSFFFLLVIGSETRKRFNEFKALFSLALTLTILGINESSFNPGNIKPTLSPQGLLFSNSHGIVIFTNTLNVVCWKCWHVDPRLSCVRANRVCCMPSNADCDAFSAGKKSVNIPLCIYKRVGRTTSFTNRKYTLTLLYSRWR